MRFVFISSMSAVPWGGSEVLWSQAAIRLHNQGHKVSAWVTWWPEFAPEIRKLADLGIEIFSQPPPEFTFSVKVVRKIKRWLGLFPGYFDWLVAQKPDLVCVSNGNYRDGLDYLEACLDKNLRYVSVVQGNAESLWPDDDAAEKIIKVYRGALRTFFVSKRNRVLLETQLGISLNNTEIIRNPFNVRWNASPPWPDERNGWKIACVARLELPTKGHDLLLQVLASNIWRDRPITISFIGTGPMEQGLRRLAAKLGVDGKVRFEGHTSDIEQIWADHHAVIVPSRNEGLPLALVEAMLCGRPAIVTDVAGNTELVQDGVTGFVAAAATVSHLAEAMERAWAERINWKKMGTEARLAAQAEIPESPAELFSDKLVDLARSRV